MTRAVTADRDVLRIVSCGSVDDGKSTLIGRLMAETQSVPDDQLRTLAGLSKRYGTTGGDLDYALLLDGLEAEREQGITIDVAYRYFGTARRAFIVADTPGHEQYTRNMITGASHSDLALLVINAGAGATRQTRRHARIVGLVGIRRVLLVVNKMDLVDFSEQRFKAIEQDFRDFARDLGIADIRAIPVSARFGDNVAQPSPKMPWYQGPTVLQHLEESDNTAAASSLPLRFLVQSVVRAENGKRGYAGFLASGILSAGDNVAIARSGRSSKVTRLYTFDGDLQQARSGQAITIELADDIDVGRGDMIAHDDRHPVVADQIAAHLVWLDQQPMLPGRTYSMVLGTDAVAATVTRLKHKVDIDGGQPISAHTLDMNDIGVCNLATTMPIAFDAYSDNRATGSFILVDRESAATVAAGMIDFALHRSGNIRHQSFDVDQARRAYMKAQRPCVVWFTGLSGAGKSTITNLVEQKLSSIGIHTYALDGDNMRMGLSRDLGFTDADRVENIRRAGEVACLMADAGLVVLCAFISPFKADRAMVKDRLAPGQFVEVFVDAPIDVCIARDPKGLYAKQKAGGAAHVTGVTSPYEPPDAPDIHLKTDQASADDLATLVVETLKARIYWDDARR